MAVNPRLERFGVLVGEWDTIGTHRLMPGVTLHSHVTCEWIENGAFLRMISQSAEASVPSGMFIFGSDNALDEITLLYYDERGVSRVFTATLSGRVLKFWRNAPGPGLAQRFTATFADDGSTIQFVSELSEDGTTWLNDLEQTYTRVR
jgi:hypothetical protein